MRKLINYNFGQRDREIGNVRKAMWVLQFCFFFFCGKIVTCTDEGVIAKNNNNSNSNNSNNNEETI